MLPRNNRPLTTVEEDFKRIGLIPDTAPLTEGENPEQVRTVPSPAPEARKDMDDSEGNKAAKSADAAQPKPKMAPDEDAEYDVDADGGSVGAAKGKSGYKAVAGGKDSQLEAKDVKAMLKRVALKKVPQGKYSAAKSKNKAVNKMISKGSMKGESTDATLEHAADLINQAEQLLASVEMSESENKLVKGFRLVSENAALLANQLSDLVEEFEVDETIEVLESLSADSATVAEIIENSDLSDDEVMEDAEVDSDDEDEEVVDSKLQKAEDLFHAMVTTLMDALEAYDATIDESVEDEEVEAEESDEEVAESAQSKEDDDNDAQDAEDDKADAEKDDCECEDDEDDCDCDDKDDDKDDKDDSKEESRALMFMNMKKVLAKKKGAIQAMKDKEVDQKSDAPKSEPKKPAAE